ncbi:MAG: hypothetical protein JXJ04_05490 [Spirochaetales bacterium]|nr:hypothetical protein [Spirochaetales bacterium]
MNSKLFQVFCLTALLAFLFSACYLGNQNLEIEEEQTPVADTRASSDAVIKNLPDLYKNFYTISIKRDSSRVFDVSYSTNNIYAGSYHGGDNQQFLVVPVAPDAREFYLVPRHSGGVMDISHTTNIYMYNDKPHGGNNQIFYLGSATIDGYYQIFSPKGVGAVDMCLSSKNRDPFDHPDKCGGNIYYFGTSHGGDNQLFKFQKGVSLSSYPFPSAKTFKYIGPVSPEYHYKKVEEPHITNFNMTPPQYSIDDAVTIAEGPIPCLYVADPIYTKETQIRNSPYYKITRKQYWNRVKYARKMAGADLTISTTTQVGVKESSSYTFSQSLSVKFSYSSTLTYTEDKNSRATAEAFEALTQTSIEYKKASEVTETKTYSITTVLPKEKQVTYALYEWVDVYTLSRMDGTVISSVKIIPENRIIEIMYIGELEYEDEPNDVYTAADGPIISGKEVSGYYSGNYDWFYVDFDTIKPIGVSLLGGYKSISIYNSTDLSKYDYFLSNGNVSGWKSYSFTPKKTGRHYFRIDGYAGPYSFIVDY